MEISSLMIKDENGGTLFEYQEMISPYKLYDPFKERIIDDLYLMYEACGIDDLWNHGAAGIASFSDQDGDLYYRVVQVKPGLYYASDEYMQLEQDRASRFYLRIVRSKYDLIGYMRKDEIELKDIFDERLRGGKIEFCNEF
jgi:hypothetical protein